MSRTAIITFGRMNPITVGHEKLVKKVKRLSKLLNATPMVYLSHSKDKLKNPIPYDLKFSLARTAFGSVVKRSNAKNVFDVLRELDGQYDNIIFVGDKARSDELLPTMNKYNGIEYNFNSIKTISAGDRTGKKLVDAISATKMRKYAADKDYNNFMDGLATNLKPYAHLVLNYVRKGMNYAN